MKVETEKVIKSLCKCIKDISSIISDEDVIHIGDSMAYILLNYGHEEFDDIEQSENHPTMIAEKALREYNKIMEEHGEDAPTLNSVKMDNSILATVIDQKAISYVNYVVEQLDGKEDMVILDVISSFVDFVEMNFGDTGIRTLNSNKEWDYLSSMVDIVDIDMMGDDFDSPPESLDRGEPQEYDPSNEDNISSSTSTAKSIIGRLSYLSDDQKDELMAMADKVDDNDQPLYTTTEIVNKANEMLAESHSEEDN